MAQEIAKDVDSIDYLVERMSNEVSSLTDISGIQILQKDNAWWLKDFKYDGEMYGENVVDYGVHVAKTKIAIKPNLRESIVHFYESVQADSDTVHAMERLFGEYLIIHSKRRIMQYNITSRIAEKADPDYSDNIHATKVRDKIVGEQKNVNNIFVRDSLDGFRAEMKDKPDYISDSDIAMVETLYALELAYRSVLEPLTGSKSHLLSQELKPYDVQPLAQRYADTHKLAAFLSNKDLPNTTEERLHGLLATEVREVCFGFLNKGYFNRNSE